MISRWDGEKRLYEKLFYAVTRRRTRILDIRPEEGELGYTSQSGEIHLAKEHPFISDLPDARKPLLRMGVFTHETLHQVFTDFQHLKDVLARHRDENEKRIIGLYANLVEDPAIEFFAPTVFGGEMLSALRFTIRHVYEQSGTLEESGSAFQQFVNALIQFGDMGKLRGRFTFPEAQDYFVRIIDSFNDTVTEKDPKKRIDAAEKWMVITRPMWMKEIEDEQNFQDMMEGLEQGLSSEMSGEGTPDIIPEDEPERDEKQERREQTASSIQKARNGEEDSDKKPEAGEESENSAGSEESEDGDKPEEENASSGASLTGPDEEASQNPSGTGHPEEKEGQKEPQASSGDDGTDRADGAGDETGTKDSAGTNPQASRSGSDTDTEEASEEEGDEASSQNAPVRPSRTRGKENGKSERERITDVLNSLSEEDTSDRVHEDFDEVAEEIWDRIVESREELEEEQKEENIDFPVLIPKGSGEGSGGTMKCLNLRQESDRSAEREYTAILAKNRHSVNLLVSSLKTMIRNDIDSFLRSTSGRYNVRRDMTRSTVKIFDKKRERRNIDDMAVLLLIDESGSMYGHKINVAKNAACVLAETFAALRIPCYIMGFTADTASSDVVHDHFVSWKNTKQERTTLARIHAQANNDDGYSVRYATQLLSHKQAEHKIMFVISDGAPACNRYMRKDGIADTKTAIREAQKKFPVMGLGIGRMGIRQEEMKEMYRGSYIHTDNVDELPTLLAKHLKRIVRNFN